jgi:xylose dehydrogenase (NAD/NADP)
MKTQALRWGLLSTARINRALLTPLRRSRRNCLVAVASRSQEKAEAYARQYHIPRAWGSYEALLADAEIDVIYNPLPNHLHAEWTIRALKAGKHVLCEKPLALSEQEVTAIMVAAREHQRVVAEAFMYRSHAQTQKVREIVASGLLGEIRMVRGAFSFRLERQEDYRLHPEQGGGSLWDVGCYPLSYTRAVLGAEPQEVFGQQITGANGIDATFVAQLHFPGPCFAQFYSSFSLPYFVFMEFVGTEGRLYIPNPFNPGRREHVYLTRNGRRHTITIQGTAPYQSEVEDMAEAILLGKPPAVSLEDSLANVRAIRALFESAQTGRPVKLAPWHAT